MKIETCAIRGPRNSHSEAESQQVVLSVATEADREMICRLRHEVYARELGQHTANPRGSLRDALDDWNVYIVAKVGGCIAGFISLTPPPADSGRLANAEPGAIEADKSGEIDLCPDCAGPYAAGRATSGSYGGARPCSAQHYSIDKYVTREALPFPFDDQLYEVRLLTVLRPHRGRELATLLMYAAFRWVESHGGTRIVAIGRREVLDMYLRSGLELLGMSVQSGAVTYDLLQVTTTALRERMRAFGGLLDRLESNTVWQLNFPFRKPAACFHGGAFFEAIGPAFEALDRHQTIINADVLDAWFPPSPKVLSALTDNLGWLLRTSPPTGCEGLIQTIAQARGVTPENVLPGGGSSDLIFRALRHWLSPASHALILNPTYGEYAHVLERVIGCTVDRLTLSRGAQYDVDLDRLEVALADNYDLVVLVNPNSPTGRHIPRAELERLLRRAPAHTRIWVDETYVDYVGAERRSTTDGGGESLERFAARSENVIVCKSMSKVYALSGARVAYLCAGAHQLEDLRAITPPWVVSLPAQVAAVRALQDPDYYAERYAQTAVLRVQLASDLVALGLEAVPGVANFILCHLDASGTEAATIVQRCRSHGLFLRDAAAMGAQLGPHAVRIAVKDRETNRKMATILREAIVESGSGRLEFPVCQNQR